MIEPVRISSAVSTRARMRAEDRREAVIAAATTIIGERGYRGFSVRELAKRCGLTNAGVLHHFGSKELLLVALLERRDRDDRQAIEDRIGPHALAAGPSRETVLAGLRAIAERNAARPELVRLYVVLGAEALMPDHPAHAFFRDRQDRTVAALAKVVEGCAADPGVAARQLAAMMTGLETQWLRSDQDFDLVTAWTDVAARILPSAESDDIVQGRRQAW